jgi:hypothetical protein
MASLGRDGLTLYSAHGPPGMSEYPQMELKTPAWLMSGIVTIDAKLGSLELREGRLRFFELGGSAPLFDIAVADIEDVTFPRYNLGSVMLVTAGAAKFRVAFLGTNGRRAWMGATVSDVGPARRRGKQWKAALAPPRQP